MKKIILSLSIIFVSFSSGCTSDEKPNIQNIQPSASLENTITPTRTIEIIAMGDSLTEGYGLKNPNQDSYPAQLEKKLLSDGYNVSIENFGISGETTTGGLARTKWIAEENPDMVLLLLGANDMFRGIDPQIVEKNISEIVDIFQENNVEVVLMPMMSQSGFGKEYQDNFDGLYERIATKKNIPLTSFPLDTIALVPEYNLKDGIHPTAQGYEIMVDNIYDAVTTEIEKF